MKIIDEIYKIGLKIVNITCNMGAANRAMWKCLQRKYLQTKDFFKKKKGVKETKFKQK